MELANILYFLMASVTLTLLPGPDLLFVITQSVSQGKRDGIAVSLGLCSGLIVHTFAAAVGISALLYHSAVAFQLLKYAGAAYLLYLAWMSLKETGRSGLSATEPKRSFFSLYKRGILMNVLNPKVSIFFLAFLPQFISPAVGKIPLQMITLGGLFFVQALLIFSLVSVFSGMAGEKLLKKSMGSKSISFVKAAVYALLGVRLALLEK